jgi:hypothetical protein
MTIVVVLARILIATCLPELFLRAYVVGMTENDVISSLRVVVRSVRVFHFVVVATDNVIDRNSAVRHEVCGSPLYWYLNVPRYVTNGSDPMVNVSIVTVTAVPRDTRREKGGPYIGGQISCDKTCRAYRERGAAIHEPSGRRASLPLRLL